MRKHLLSLLVLLLAGFGLARGQSNYDFYHVSGDDTLYFKYTSTNTCKLVPPSLYNDWYGYTQPSGRVTIPDTVNYSYLVTEIAPSAFYGCTGITYLYVPPTIASIGESAFQGCSYLNEIYFDSSTSWTLSLDTIGPNAFAGCTRINWVFFCSTLEKWMNVGLGNAASNPMSYTNWSGVCLRGWWGNPPQRVDVPTSIHKIKKYTFYKWNAIREITMSDTLVTSIGDSAFFGIVHLDSLWIGHGVTHIGAGAFQGCSSLDFVRMGNSVSSIGERAFEGCSSLAALTLPSITAVPNRLCYGCSHLHSIVIPNSVTSIGDYAFYNCSDMASLTLGNHVSSIGGYAFVGCGRLLSVTIPRSVRTIGYAAFRNNSFLSTLNFNADSCTSVNSYWLDGCNRLTNVNIGDHVKIIPANFVSGKTGLTNIVIPDSVVTIGESAFSGCTGLTSLTIPNSVVTIEGSAFSGCTGLTSLTIPNSVVTVGQYAFSGCTGMSTLTIGKAVSSIGNNAFQNCTGLDTVNFNADSLLSNSSIFQGTNISTLNIGSNVRRIPNYTFQNCSGLTETTIPDSVVTIGQYAFSGCTGMSTLTIGKAVSSIGNNAFQNCTGLNTVNFNADSCISMCSSSNSSYRAFAGSTNISTLNIGSNVKIIPNYAFMDCSNIVSLTIPDSVKSIGQYAFSGCTGLSTLTIGKAVSSIGNYAFQNDTLIATVNFNADSLLTTGVFSGRTNITTLNIGNGVKSIPGSTFSGCTGLTSLTIPNSVVTIGGFSGCTGLTSLTIPNSVVTIRGSAFYGCTGLTSLTVPNYVVNIGGSAFSGCTGLDTVNFYADSLRSNSSIFSGANISTLIIGSNVKRIPDYTFQNCSGLTDIVIPDSVKTIGQYAFSGCTGMSTLTIGKAVSSIGSYAFQNDTLIATVNFNADSLLTTGVFSGLTNITTLNIGSNVKRIPNSTFSVCTGLTNITIPDSVITIGNYAFSGCTGMSTLTIGKAVSSIGNYAFQNCTGLDTVDFNADSCISVDPGNNGNRGAFVGCTNISTLNIGNNVKIVPAFAFRGCTGLTTLTIGKSVSSIGNQAFQNCTGLDTVNFNADSCISVYSSSYLYRAFLGCTNLSTLILGSNVKLIPDFAFMNCSNLGAVTILDSVVTIGNNAFQGCTGLTTLVIPNSVMTIGDYAFSGCSGLTSLAIPNSVVTIGDAAFSGCSGLTSLTIPNSVVTIGSSSFSGCTGLTSLTIPNSVETIGGGAFSGCTGMSTLTIGKAVSYIGGNAFNNCTNLSTVNYNADSCFSMYTVLRVGYSSVFGGPISTLNIGRNVKMIPNYAFYNCFGLTSLVIPDSVETIGYRAFDAIDLDTIVSYNLIPPTLDNNAFSYSSQTKVFVPCHAGAAYRTDAQWGQFSQIYEQECQLYDFWAVAPSGDTLYYSIQNSNSVKVVCPHEAGWGNSTRPTGLLIIPATVMNEGVTYNVTSIGDSAFYSCTSMTEVTIPNTIDSIGKNAFVYCSGLTTVNLNADSCIYAGSQDLTAFYGCTNFTHLNIGSNVKRIPSYAFRGCTHLDTLTIPASISTIGYNAFYGCTGLTTVYFNADSCIDMGLDLPNNTIWMVLGGCGRFTLIVGENVKLIPQYGFAYTNTFDIVLLGSVPPVVEDYVFYNTTVGTVNVPCSSWEVYQASDWGRLFALRSDNCPNYDFWAVAPSGDTLYYRITDSVSVQTVHPFVSDGWGAFTKPSGALTIPSTVMHEGVEYTVTEIGERAFSYCSEITAITISDSIRRIGEYAFFNCQSVDSIFVVNEVPPTLGYDVFGMVSTNTPVIVPCQSKNAYRATAWNRFAHIVGTGDCPYYDFWAVAPSGDTLYYIKNNSTSVRVVYPDEYEYWTGYTQPMGALIIPTIVEHDSTNYYVTRVDSRVFTNCTGITEVTIPEKMELIGDSAFAGCTSLRKVNYNAESCTTGCFAGDTNITTVTVGNHVRHMPAFLFQNCTALDTLFFNADSCIHAGSSIDNRALVGCEGLSTVFFGSNVKRIPNFLFAYNTGLDTVTIPNSVASIGYNAFYGCTGLTTVYFNADSCTNAGYDIVEDMIYFVLGGCPNFTNLNIGDNVKILPSFAFWNCSGLRHVVVPNSVQSIGRRTFSGCTSLNTIETGSGVSMIDDYAFQSCTNLLEFISHNPVPPIVANNTFMSVPSYANVYVPCGSVPSYDSVWTYFTNINELYRAVLVTGSHDTVMGSVMVVTTPSCTTAAVIEAVPNTGYRFDHWSDGDTTNPRSINMAFNDSLSITAYFSSDQCVLSVVSSNSAWGTTTGSGIYVNSTTVTISAVPEYGYHFTMWSDGVTDNPRSIIVTRDTVLTALFDRNQYALTAQCDSTQGSVTGSSTYLYEDTATVTATAAYGYHFTMWSDGITANPRSVVVTRDTMLTAQFSRNQYALTIHCDSTQGTASGAGTYLYEDTATVTATAAYGYHFTMWSDGITANPRSVVVTRDTMLTAQFSRNQYTLTTQCDSTQGTVVGAGTYLYEDTATVTATAAYGYHFTMWSDGTAANPLSVVVTRDTVLTALFDRNEYVLTVVCDETQGVVTGAGTYLFGDVARVTVTANEGFVFSHWAETGITEVAFDTIINGNVTLTALFDTLYHTLSLTSNNPEWGTVDGGGEYAHGREVTVTATAHEGFRFTGWSDGSVENPRTIVVNENMELMANFAELTGIVDAAKINVTLFPNPTNGLLHIKADNVLSVEVCTMEGRVVMRGTQTNSIDMSSLPTGVYYIRIDCQQGKSVHKVVKR